MKKQLLVLSTFVTIALSGCGAGTNHKIQLNDNMGYHGKINYSSSGKVPKNLKIAENPTYKVGSKAIIKANHMEGMNRSKATIVGTYDTTAYVVSYISTIGGAKVKNHKWVIQEEIENAKDQTLQSGAEVTLKADHMKGMNEAKATIDLAEKTTVYMVDYITITGGDQVKNYKWVTESELSK